MKSHRKSVQEADLDHNSSATTCPTSGTSTIEGAQIAWVKDTTTEIITLTITADDGTVTTMAVPIGDFKF